MTVGYEITFDGGPDTEDETFSLASQSGWSDFAAWVTTLPAEEYPHLHALVDDGIVLGTDELADQIREALEAHPPEVDGVTETAAALRDRIGVGDEAENAVVVDGVNEDGGEGDQDRDA